MNIEQLSRLITVVMEASVGQLGWDALACELADTFEAESCCFHVRDSVSSVVQVIGKSPSLDDGLIADYETWYFRDDLLATRALQTTLNHPALSDELVPEEEFVATDFYQNFCLPQGIYHALCGAQDIGNNYVCILRLYRPKERAPFNAADKHRLGLVLPHLKSAMRLDYYVRSMVHGQQISYNVIDQLSLGTVVVGVGGVVRHANKTMERMLNADLGITLRHGRLVLEDGAAQQALVKALEKVQQTGHGTMLPIRDKTDRPLSLMIAALPQVSKSSRPIGAVATIFINDPNERRKPGAQTIAKLYGLTAAEAKLARALLDGDRLQDYAETAGISLHTVKTQLKQIFMKTGHSRQGDLVRDIMSNTVLRMRC